jgi:hypothetical protein
MSAAYRIGMEISLANNVSHVFGTIAADMLRIQGLQGQLTRGFQQMRMAMLGTLGVFAGGAMIHGLGRLIDRGNEWIRVTRNMEMAGVSLTDALAAQHKAMEQTREYRNISATDVLKVLNDMRMTMGSQALATEHIEPLIRAGSYLRAYMGHEKGGKSFESLERELVAAIKSSEIAGKITPEELNQHVLQLTAMKTAFGDQVSIQNYLTAQRAAGVALRNASDEFRYGWFPALVQENGVNAGTMLMTAYNKIVAGTGNRSKALERMTELGLTQKDLLDYDKVGRVKGLTDPGGVKGSLAAAIGMGDWVVHTLKPLLDRRLDKEMKEGKLEWTGDLTKIAREHGVEVKRENLRTVREAQWISQMWPDRNAAKAITEMLQQFTKISREAKMTGQTYDTLTSPGKIREYLANSWDFQVEAFHEQWHNFLTFLGVGGVGPAVRALAGINDALAGMAKWTMDNPAGAQGIVAGIAGLSAALVGGGTAAIIAALGPAGWLAGGVIGLGVALTSAGVNFNGAFEVIGSAVKSIVSVFQLAYNGQWDQVGELIGRALVRVPVALAEAAYGMASGIATALGEAILAIPSKVVPAIWEMSKGIVKGFWGEASETGIGTKGLFSLEPTHKKQEPWFSIDIDGSTLKNWFGFDNRDQQAHEAVQRLVHRIRDRMELQAPIARPGVETIQDRTGEKGAPPASKAGPKTVNNNVSVGGVSVSVNVQNSTQAPAAVGQAVGAAVSAKMRGAIHDLPQ